MEGALEVLVRKRSEALSRLSPRIPPRLRHRLIPHALAFLCTFALFTYDFGHERGISIFSFHPTFMALAFTAFLPEGLMVYKNCVLFDILSPIMAHGARTKKRTIHSSLQMTAGAMMLLGLTFAVINKAAHHVLVTPRTWHGRLGLVIVGLVFTQMLIGRLKLQSLTQGVVDSRSNLNAYRWHGNLGVFIFDLGIVGAMTGLVTWVGVTLKSLVLLCMLSSLWVSVALQLEGDSSAEKREGGSGDDSESGLAMEPLNTARSPDRAGAP